MGVSHESSRQVSLVLLFVHVLVLFMSSCEGAPEPKNFLFEGDTGEQTTQAPISEPVTSVEYVLIDNVDNELSEGGVGQEDFVAQPSETSEKIVASASSPSSSIQNEIDTGSTGAKSPGSNTQMNLLLLQQLQEQLRRQQQIQQLALQSQQQVQQIQAPTQTQQQQQQQFSLDALVKSVFKVIHVAKTKIDQGAKTFRDILQLFDRKKYVNITPQAQASENSIVVS